mgnify:CR=1 FL=1|jgi:hypothetical protein
MANNNNNSINNTNTNLNNVNTNYNNTNNNNIALQKMPTMPILDNYNIPI